MQDQLEILLPVACISWYIHKLTISWTKRGNSFNKNLNQFVLSFYVSKTNKTKQTVTASPIHVRQSDKSWGKYKRDFASGTYRYITKHNVIYAKTESDLKFIGTWRKVYLK